MQDRDGALHRNFLVRDGDRAEAAEREADDEAGLVLRALLGDGRPLRAVARVQRVSVKRGLGADLRPVLEVAVDVGEGDGASCRATYGQWEILLFALNVVIVVGAVRRGEA